jgi:hypothetical protein
MINCLKIGIILFVFVGCRKDPSIPLPEPEGNLLVCQLNEQYEIVGEVELSVASIVFEEGFIAVDEVTTSNGLAFNWQLKSNFERLIEIENNKLIYPSMPVPNRLLSTDDRLYSSYEKIAFSANFDLQVEAIQKTLLNRTLIHAYLNKNENAGIHVFKAVLNDYLEEEDMQVPVVRYFALIGFETD